MKLLVVTLDVVLSRSTLRDGSAMLGLGDSAIFLRACDVPHVKHVVLRLQHSRSLDVLELTLLKLFKEFLEESSWCRAQKPCTTCLWSWGEHFVEGFFCCTWVPDLP